MKILQVNKFLKNSGGSESYMFQLSNSLIELGHEIKYWGMYDSKNITHDFEDLLVDHIDYKNQTTIQKISSAFRTIYSYQSKRNIAKVLDEFKPDIVHIHNYNFQITPSILPEIKKRGIKIIQTIHDSQMVCPYHRLYNFQKDKACTKCVEGSFFNCVKDKCFDGSTIKSLLATLESVYYHEMNYYDKYIDVFISPSTFLKELIEKRIRSNIQVIPNFTNVTYEDNKTLKRNSHYTYYGRLSEEKGIFDLINVFKKTNLSLKIVGKGNLETQIIDAIKGFENIEFMGFKEGLDLFQYIQNSKYIIQLPKWYENCPMTVIESYALNVPIIAYNHSGYKELIDDGKTGYLLDLKNPTEISKRLLEIDKYDVELLNENIKSFYKRNLSKETHITKILEIYNDLLSQS